MKSSKLAKKIITVSSVVFVLFFAVVIALSCIVDFSIKRGAEAGGKISGSLSTTEDPEKQNLEKMAVEMRDFMNDLSLVWADKTGYETWGIQTFYKPEKGITLRGYAFIQPAERATGDWAVVIHGYHGKAQSFWQFAQYYYEKGFNVFTPDLRAAGISEGKYIGMGWLDRRDLILWLDELVNAKGAQRILLHGFSMGAATIMMASGESDFPAEVKVCIEDSGYSSDWDEMADKLRQIYRLPKFPVLHAASIMTKIKAGYSMKEADCVKSLKRNKTPMFFVHGDADDYNPFWMLDVVYEADACPEKYKLVIPGARHVMSAYVQSDVYWNTIWDFVEKYWN